jgi:hypothetical protein
MLKGLDFVADSVSSEGRHVYGHREYLSAYDSTKKVSREEVDPNDDSGVFRRHRRARRNRQKGKSTEDFDFKEQV